MKQGCPAQLNTGMNSIPMLRTKNKPRMRNLIKIVIQGILIMLVFGCGSENKKEASKSAQNSPGLHEKFIIMGYSGPPAGELNLERYQEIADAGIEILVPGNGTFSAEQNLNAMDMAQKVGIGIIPVDMRVLPFALKPDISIDPEMIRTIVYDYKNHPALAGYVIKDEPNADLFPSLAELSALFREKDPNHEPLINLFPSYGSPVQLGFDDYRSYVSSFIKTVHPGLLSYDNYALRVGSTWYDSWYSDLEIVREETKKAQIPFMVFVQSEGIREGLRVPNRSEILWQVNTALAYGARGIGWFCYWTPCARPGIPSRGRGSTSPG